MTIINLRCKSTPKGHLTSRNVEEEQHKHSFLESILPPQDVLIT